LRLSTTTEEASDSFLFIVIATRIPTTTTSAIKVIPKPMEIPITNFVVLLCASDVSVIGRGGDSVGVGLLVSVRLTDTVADGPVGYIGDIDGSGSGLSPQITHLSSTA
jgi:hypothetical protein